MSNLKYPLKAKSDKFSLDDLNFDLNSLNDDKLEKNGGVMESDMEVQKALPAMWLNCNRTNKSGLKWNADADADYGMEIYVDGELPAKFMKDMLMIKTAGGGYKDVKSVCPDVIVEDGNIQDAVDSVKLTGGNVILPSGTYRLTAPIKIYSNIYFKGLGSVIIQKTAGMNAFFYSDLDANSVLYTGIKNVKVENIAFDGECVNEPCTIFAVGHGEYIRLNRCRFMNLSGDWHMVEFNSTKKGFITNCIFDNYLGTTEMIQLDYCGGTEQFPWTAKFDNTPCEDIIIENNIFMNCPNGKAIGNHSFLAGVKSKNVIIRNNLFDTINNYVINLGDISKFEISDNYFTNCPYAMWIYKSLECEEHVIIKNNYYDGGHLTVLNQGIEGRFIGTPITAGISDIRIEDNIVLNAYAHGIGITADNVFVKGNFINGCGANGLYLYGTSKSLISGNNIAGNNTRGGYFDIVVGNNADKQTRYTIMTNNWFDTGNLGSNTIATEIAHNAFLSWAGSTYCNLSNNWINGGYVASGNV